MDQDADKHCTPGLRRPRSGEGMASVIEHLREQLRTRQPDLGHDRDRDRDPDDTRPPAD